MIESGYLPEGAVQIGLWRTWQYFLDFVKDGDSVVFTGSAKQVENWKALPSDQYNSF